MATDHAVIGAMRLGLEAADGDKTALSLVKALLEKAPPTPKDELEPTALLIETVKETGNWALAQT